MPSTYSSMQNLAKAKACWRAPRPWRSYQETRLIRCLVWQWYVSGVSGQSRCAGRALARWLGVSHTYIQKLGRIFSVNPNDGARMGSATIEDLRRAREETGKQRERGSLRRPTATQMACLVAGVTRPPATRAANANVAPPDYTAIHIAHLRMQAEQQRVNVRFIAPRRWR